MPGHDIVVVGASAGGVEALGELVRGLPADLPAAVFIVLHVPRHGSSVLPAILNRAKTLPAAHPSDGQPIQRGHIYIAPPDHLPENMEIEADIAELEMDALQRKDRPGIPSGFSCPQCGGVLNELYEAALMRFRCRTGHAYSPDSLLAEQAEVLEEALWSALRALEESAALAHRLRERAGSRGHNLAAVQFEEQARSAEQRAAVIRLALLKEQRIGSVARSDDDASASGDGAAA